MTAAQDLWPVTVRVLRAVSPRPLRATNESVRREWDAINAELVALGIPTVDHYAATASRTWWTAQNDAGRVMGMWADSWEEAVITLGLSWGAPIRWCVDDRGLEVAKRYKPHGNRNETDRDRAFEVTDEPIPGPEFAPTTSLLELLDGVA